MEPARVAAISWVPASSIHSAIHSARSLAAFFRHPGQTGTSSTHHTGNPIKLTEVHREGDSRSDSCPGARFCSVISRSVGVRVLLKPRVAFLGICTAQHVLDALVMTLNRVGKYRLSQHLHSAANIDGYRAVQVDSDGSYVRHVYVCGLRDIADTPDERSDIVGKLSEFRDYLTLPNFLPILDVFDDSASSGFDVVVVSQWCGGCSLARLLDVSAAPGLRLALYVMRVLCTSLSESYRRMTARGQTPPVGVLSADRVWIDHQGTITMHNPFVESGAGGLDDTNTASGRDVAALQYILRGLTNAWVRRADAGSDLPSDVTALLEKAREPGENTLDFLDRFKTPSRTSMAALPPTLGT